MALCAILSSFGSPQEQDARHGDIAGGRVELEDVDPPLTHVDRPREAVQSVRRGKIPLRDCGGLGLCDARSKLLVQLLSVDPRADCDNLREWGSFSPLVQLADLSTPTHGL